MIPFFGIARQYESLREELLDAVNRVYSSGRVLDGNYTLQFEREMAKRCDRHFAVAVNSCTQGLVFSLLAAQGQSYSSNVIIPNVSFSATLNSLLLARCSPVFCDVNTQGLIDLEKLAYNPKSYNINTLMYVNLFGNVVDIDRIKLMTEFFSEMFVIEDAAQSFGSSYKGIPSGKLGDISVLSFDPTKNLPNYGSGGMVLTDDYSIYFSIANLRDNGKESGHMTPGTNSKMSESDCAQMLIKLKYFNSWQKRRTDIANYYTEQLRHYVRVTETTPEAVHSWHKYPVWVEDRHVLMNKLQDRGIETKIHYSTPLSELGCSPSSGFLYPQGNFPLSEAHCKTELSLPIYPELQDAEVEYIVDSVIRSISI